MRRQVKLLRRQVKQMREALTLAEDILSRAPFSTGIWPNGMHPQRGIKQIRESLNEAWGPGSGNW
jgi:hypothetical protein